MLKEENLLCLKKHVLKDFIKFLQEEYLEDYKYAYRDRVFLDNIVNTIDLLDDSSK